MFNNLRQRKRINAQSWVPNSLLQICLAAMELQENLGTYIGIGYIGIGGPCGLHLYLGIYIVICYMKDMQ